MKHDPVSDETRGRAKELRRQMTGPERELWGILRSKRLAGLKFRRQHPIGPFIADFFCADAALVVELDGITHVGQADDDERRSQYLRNHGLHVMRFSNDQVVQGTEEVVSDILRYSEQHRSAPLVLDGIDPPPLKGGAGGGIQTELAHTTEHPPTAPSSRSSSIPPPTPPFKGGGLRGHFKRWRLADAGGAADDAAVARLARELRVDPLVAALLARRGFADAEAAKAFIEPKLTHLHDPATMAGCDRAAGRLVEAVRAGERIVIYGDYDVDGITATAILFHAIKAASPDADVRRYVPHRIDEGYGLNADAIAQLADEGARVIVSVDCGITAIEPAAIAEGRGVDLIVTDHHEPRADGVMPDAYALVHPALTCEATGRPYPWRDICGAGVAYKLAWQFTRRWCGTDRVPDVFRTLLVDLLPFAALGTIADVVPLVDENRVIAMHGLGRIKRTPWLGLNALIDASRLRDEKIDSYHVGFVLGPRLNACGRMGHAKEAVDLLTDAPPDEAAKIAAMLSRENDTRRATERRIFEQAKAMVVERGYDGDDVRVIVLGDAEWHPGVVGIVCSRLVEQFGRPTVLLNTANGIAAGSARSIDGFSIVEAFDACAEHLVSHGGHAMAAGLKLECGRLDAFRDAMIAHAAERLSPADLVPVLDIDAQVTLDAMTVGVGEQVERLAPFGRSNPSPVVLIRDVTLRQSATTMGGEARHLCMNVEQDGRWLRCVGWNMGHLADRLPAGSTVDLAGVIQLNRFRGRVSVELVVSDLRIA